LLSAQTRISAPKLIQQESPWQGAILHDIPSMPA
jgi:hypothetical protein